MLVDFFSTITFLNGAKAVIKVSLSTFRVPDKSRSIEIHM